MRAAVYERYGPPEVVEVREVSRPVPNDGEVLIRVHATTVNSADHRLRSLDMPQGFGILARLALGVSRPRQPILGAELSGVIESVGKDVHGLAAGDEVFAFTGARMGCHAEYKVMAQDGPLALKPASLRYDEAAALSFGGTTALDFFRRAKLQRGEKVLINGASGTVGTAAVQIARHFGAEVTAVCSTANLGWVKALGATEVIDYTREDFTANGRKYDVIVDTVGTAPFSRSRRSLERDGRLLLVLGGLSDMLRIPWAAITSRIRIIAAPARERAEDLRFLAGLAEAGEFRPVIDRRYPLDQIVEAHRYVDTNRKKGSVVINVR